MSETALTPEQLDLIEDALEDLELEGAPPLREGDDGDRRAVAETLVAYRSILTLSREALPSEEVPAGLLDDVIAQARQSAAAAPAPAVRVPWYRRLGPWGPALAFAGTAAALVLFVRPGGEDAAQEEASGPVATREAPPASDASVPAAEAPPDASRDLDGVRLAEAEKPAEAEDDPFGAIGDPMAGRGAAAEERAEADDDEADRRLNAELKPSDPLGGEGGLGRKAPTPVAKSKKASASSAGSSTSSSKGGTVGGYDKKLPGSPKPSAGPAGAPAKSAPAPDPAPAPQAPPATKADEVEKKEQKAGGWADVASGDAQRRAGSCGAAKTSYSRAAEDDAADVRARGLAGLGLCELDAGRVSAAEALFAKARAADGKVAKFIAAERPRHEPADQANMADQAAEAPSE